VAETRGTGLLPQVWVAQLSASFWCPDWLGCREPAELLEFSFSRLKESLSLGPGYWKILLGWFVTCVTLAPFCPCR